MKNGKSYSVPILKILPACENFIMNSYDVGNEFETSEDLFD